MLGHLISIARCGVEAEVSHATFKTAHRKPKSAASRLKRSTGKLQPSRSLGATPGGCVVLNSHFVHAWASVTTNAVVVLCTAPNVEAARGLAGGLVEARLAACVNVVGGVESVYRWQGKIEHETEVLLVIKTAAHRLDEVKAHLQAAHPYEVPEIIALPITGGSDVYLSWLLDAVG